MNRLVAVVVATPVVAALLAACGAAAPPAALPAPPAHTTPEHAVAEAVPATSRTDSKRELAEQIKDLAGDEEGPYVRPPRDIGFSALSVGSPMTVWWKGDVPADVTALIEDAREHFDVVVLPASTSFVDIHEGTRSLMKLDSGPPVDPRLAAANIAIWSIAAPSDGSGLQVTYRRADENRAAPSKETVVRVVEQISGIPVVDASVDDSRTL